jgi:SAM-dependent methyltransferase
VSSSQPPAEKAKRRSALESGGPLGWLARLWRRATLAALLPELGELEEQRARQIRQLDESTVVRRRAEILASRLTAIQREAATYGSRIAEQMAALETAANERAELKQHVETRFDQVLAEVADLRGAFFAVRGEFEQARDRHLPQLSSRADESEAVLTRLQGEIETLRDSRLPQAELALERQQSALAALLAEVEAVRDRRVPQAEADLAAVQRALELHQGELAELRELRLGQTETALANVQGALELHQNELAELRDLRLTQAESSLATVQAEVDRLHEVLARVQRLSEEVRDERLPVLARRVDALLGKLREDFVSTAGMVDRLAQREPLRVTVDPAIEAQIPAAVTAASRRFMDQFRGDNHEIRSRVSEYVPELRDAAPVLDLGCGRGELLEALRDAGVEARGVDGDPAMVVSCQERGLAVAAADALEAIRAEPPANLGAVVAIHLLEHLPAAAWMTVIEASATALRRGGVLLIECPNPESLRVGADLFWIDPTHRVPIHPEALDFVIRAVGLEVVERRFLHPFPPEQSLAQPDQPEAVRALAERLDVWLSAPRDFVIIARKP